MKLYIIRHGHKANQEPGYNGGFNTPLSDRGKKQAEHLGEFMADEEIDCLYSSSQLRALQTAEPIHRHSDREWHVWPVFCEVNGMTLDEERPDDPELARRMAAWPPGEAVENPTLDELDEKHGNYYRLSDISDQFPGVQLSQPFPYPEAWWVPHEDQTYSTGFTRVELGLQALLNRHNEGDRVAIVCHVGSGNMMMTSIMDFPRKRPWRFPLDKTGVSCMEQQEDWRMLYVNRTNHLPTALQS